MKTKADCSKILGDFNFDFYRQPDSQKNSSEITFHEKFSLRREKKFVGDDEYVKFDSLFKYSLLSSIFLVMILMGYVFSIKDIETFLLKFLTPEKTIQVMLTFTFTFVGLFLLSVGSQIYYLFKSSQIRRRIQSEDS